MRIICLDDHPTMLDSLVRELNIISPTSTVYAFQDPETALEFSEANGCDVLFCEIDLYGKDGVMLAEKMKGLNPKLNIIFTTVCEESERAKEVFRLHPSGYITKPYTHDQLMHELSNLRYPVEERVNLRGSAYPAAQSYAPRGESRPVGEFSASPACPQRSSAAAPAFRDRSAAAPSFAPAAPAAPEAAAAPAPAPAAGESKTQAASGKDLRRLGRAELLEMLITQTKENDKLKAELVAAEEKLENKNLNIENAGSIAQAAMQMNGVFEAAQRAADQYLENIRIQSVMMSQREQEHSERMERMLAETRARCTAMENESARHCDDMVREAEAETRARWDELHQKMEAYLKEHEQLRSLMMGVYK